MSVNTTTAAIGTPSSAHAQYAYEVARDRAAQDYEDKIKGLNNQSEERIRQLQQLNKNAGPRDLPSIISNDSVIKDLIRQREAVQLEKEAFETRFAQQQTELEMARRQKPDNRPNSSNQESVRLFNLQQERAQEISENIKSERESRIADAASGAANVSDKTIAAQKFNESALAARTTEKQTPDTKPQPTQNNVTTNYEATLELARETGVHQSLYNDLAPTFQKDAQKQFEQQYAKNQHYLLGLSENLGIGDQTAAVSTTPQNVIVPQVEDLTRQQQRLAKLLGPQGNATGAIQKQVDYQTEINNRNETNQKKESVNVLTDTIPGKASAFFRAPQDLAVSLNEGAPKKPREYTQDEVNQMSPAEYARYRADIDAYNSYVQKLNENILLNNIEQKKAGLQRFKEFKQNILSFVEEGKKEGFGLVSIKTNAGEQVVPIDRAYRAILGSKEIEGISLVPVIPKGYTLAGNLTSQVLIQEPRTIKQDITGKITEEYGTSPLTYGPQKPIDKDPLTLLGEHATQIAEDASKNPIQRGIAGIAQEGISTLGGLTHLENKSFRAFADMFQNDTGANSTKIETIVPEIPLPQTVTTTSLGVVTKGAVAAVISKNPDLLVQSGQQAITETSKLIQKQGIAPTVGQTIGFLIPLGGGSPVKIVKTAFEAVPAQGLKFGKFTVSAIEKGTGKTIVQTFKDYSKAEDYAAKLVTAQKTDIAKITAVQESVKSLQVFGRNVVSKVGDKYVLGSPKNAPLMARIEAVKNINPTGRGLELGTQNKYSQSFLTSKEGLEALQGADILLPRDVEAINLAKEAAKIINDNQSLFGKKTYPNLNTLESLRGQEENKVIFEQHLPKSKVPIKGHAAEIAQVRPEILNLTPRTMTGDIDRDFTLAKTLGKLGLGKLAERYSYAKALADVTKAKQLLEQVAEPNRAFKIIGTKLFAGEADKAKPLFEVKLKKNEVVHGTDKPSGKDILTKGVDVKASKRATGFFTTPYVKLAEQYAARATRQTGKKPTLLKSELESRLILDYAKIPKADRLKLTNRDWLKYQTNVIEYAKAKGYLGVTKPYKTTNPFTKKVEVIIFDEAAITPKELIRPTGYDIIGKGEKVLENLTHKDIELSGSPYTDFSQVFGTKYNYNIIKGKSPEGKTIKYRSLQDQALSKLTSFMSIQGPRTEKFAGAGTPDFLKGEIQTTEKGLTTIAPESRLKDPFDLVKLDIPELATRLIESKKGAKAGYRLQEIADQYPKLYPEIDFTTKTPIKEENVFETGEIPSAFSRYGINADSVSRGSRVATMIGAQSESRPSTQEQNKSRINSILQRANSRGVSSPYSKSITRSKPESTISKLTQRSKSNMLISESKSSPINSKIEKSKTSVSRVTPSKSTPSLLSPIKSEIRPSPLTPSVPSPIKPSPLTPSKLTPSKFSPVQSKLKELKIKPLIPINTGDINFTHKQEQMFKEKRLKNDEFIGNTRIADIMGLYGKRETVTVGAKKARKLARQDLSKTYKEKGTKFIQQKKQPIISNRKTTILTKPKKNIFGTSPKKMRWL